MQVATGGSMLNFGYWPSDNLEPLSAQNNLCVILGDLAELSSAKYVVDVGSGLSAPSKLWRDNFPNLILYDVNINYNQLLFPGFQKNISFLNATSTKLPFANDSVDRVMALESAQHFKPLSDFILESKRILKKSGLLVIAIPIVSEISSFGKLGVLKFTWSSEHYTLDYLKHLVISTGFSISNEKFIGSNVYPPLADYYVQNRTRLKKLILESYPSYVEKILFESLLKMKKSSDENVIDYVLLKCTL